MRKISDHDTSTDAATLLYAGTVLQAFTDILKSQHRQLSPEQINLLNEYAAEHVELAKSANVHLVPKHHMMLHMAGEAQYKGNPKYYATWMDETINRFISNAAASCHRRTLERKSLQKSGMLLERGSAY
eukprot:9503561-Pyramimonas_sp.AAC.1